MKINRRVLKIKSRFYYYTLVFIGSISLLCFSRCGHSPSPEEKAAHTSDSLAKVKFKQDSTARADSASRADKEQLRLDSVAKADSIHKTKTSKNPFKPPKPIAKYGIPMPPPEPKYGVHPITK